MRVINSENRAQSRLSSTPASSGATPATNTTQTVNTKPKLIQPHHHQHKRQVRGFTLPKLGQNYQPLINQLSLRIQTQWRSLILGIIGLAAIFYILTTIEPKTIANWLIYQSYLPLLIVVALTFYWLTKFATLSRWVAITFSFGLTIILFLKLQQVELDLWVWSTLVVFTLLSLIAKRLVIRQ